MGKYYQFFIEYETNEGMAQTGVFDLPLETVKATASSYNIGQPFVLSNNIISPSKGRQIAIFKSVVPNRELLLPNRKRLKICGLLRNEHLILSNIFPVSDKLEVKNPG
jgi:hypothetical protein